MSRTRSVKLPTRANPTDAGLDFYIPTIDVQFTADFEAKNQSQSVHLGKDRIVINPHARVLIPSGIKTNVPDGFALIAHNKSGISAHRGLDVLATVVDSSYQGELHISLVNTSADAVELRSGEKAVQFLLIPIQTPIPVEVPEHELFAVTSGRGDGGFGSTGSQW